VRHRLSGILHDRCTLEPGNQVGWIDFQDGSKVAAGAGALSGLCSFHAPLHQCCDLLIRGCFGVTLFHP
jgi:hypothetical protein